MQNSKEVSFHQSPTTTRQQQPAVFEYIHNTQQNLNLPYDTYFIDDEEKI